MCIRDSSTAAKPEVEKDDAFLRKLNAGKKVIAIELDSPKDADLTLSLIHIYSISAHKKKPHPGRMRLRQGKNYAARAFSMLERMVS